MGLGMGLPSLGIGDLTGDFKFLILSVGETPRNDKHNRGVKMLEAAQQNIQKPETLQTRNECTTSSKTSRHRHLLWRVFGNLVFICVYSFVLRRQ